LELAPNVKRVWELKVSHYRRTNKHSHIFLMSFCEQVKVKISLSTILTAHRRNGGTAPLTFNLGTDGGYQHQPRRLYLRQITPVHTVYEAWWTPKLVWTFSKKKTPLPLPLLEVRIVQPVA
jgi:hypothetical protein